MALANLMKTQQPSQEVQSKFNSESHQSLPQMQINIEQNDKWETGAT
jgi:hypothetical protein